ncbi:MAG: hypothetical protein MJ204_06280 [Bacteroidales bacterium]|nr:hypothetical protein [Bacteroidales bacterium]
MMNKVTYFNMTNNLTIISLCLIFLLAPLTIKEKTTDLDEFSYEEEIVLDYIGYKDLYARIARIESRHRYDVANKTKMVGKYQASRSALLEFGYSEDQIQAIYDSFDTTYTEQGHARYTFDIETFPAEDQERFICWYMKRMEKVYLKEMIDKYVGTTVNNVYITRAGILNASMLGFNHVVRFLESNGEINYTPRKGYSIKNRLQQFERTEIES